MHLCRERARSGRPRHAPGPTVRAARGLGTRTGIRVRPLSAESRGGPALRRVAAGGVSGGAGRGGGLPAGPRPPLAGVWRLGWGLVTFEVELALP